MELSIEEIKSLLDSYRYHRPVVLTVIFYSDDDSRTVEWRITLIKNDPEIISAAILLAKKDMAGWDYQRHFTRPL